MAHFLELISDEDDPFNLKDVQLRPTPDLPDHVLGAVQWLGFVAHPGYYLYTTTTSGATDHVPVEFLDNNWYFINQSDNGELTYTCREDHIEPYAHRTGYWRISDPQHPEHVPEELPLVPSSSTAGPSTLNVPRERASTLESEELSPFRFAYNPDLDPDQDQEEYFSSVAEATTDVLAAQFQHVLDIQEREPENPDTPEVPAYLLLVEEAVEAGLHVPPPPPLVQEEPEQQQEQPDAQPVQPPVLQVIIPAPVPAPQPILIHQVMAQQAQQQVGQQQAAPAAPAQAGQQAGPTDKLRGSIPITFTGDRRKSEKFMRQFNLLWGLNETHEIMTVPYFRAMFALSLMNGPNIDDWAHAQVTTLRDRSTCA